MRRKPDLSTPPPLPLDEQLCFALYAASMAINRAYKPMLDQLGITYPQFLVLQTLHEQDGRSITQVATRLALELSTITPLVRRLEAAGLVRRSRHPDDERQVRLHLTRRGQEVWAQSGCLGVTMVERSGMPVATLAALRDQIRDLRAAIVACVPDSAA